MNRLLAKILGTACAFLIGTAGCARTPSGIVHDELPGPDAPITLPDTPQGETSDTPAACSAGPVEPSWYRTAVGYEIFVRSFADSNGDGVGDLRGLIDRLDYLNDGDPATHDDLGVTLLWLMPVNASPSYHGYDVTDYRAIHPDYGTLTDMDALIAAAHARGIRVITDLVLNHTSSDHAWFKDSASGDGAARRDWFVWSAQQEGWTQPWGGGQTWHRRGNAWYYGLFSEYMPDLNYRNPAVRAEMTDVARFWLARGLDGFRLDAARYLVETGPAAGQQDTELTHAFWKEFRAATGSTAQNGILVAEAWAPTDDLVSYFGTAAAPELHMAFDFDGAGALIQSVQKATVDNVQAHLCARLETYPPWGTPGVFLSNHDQKRVATQLASTGLAGMKLAAALMMTLPGTPWIYYGEEIGMRNGVGDDDLGKRLPMQWDGSVHAGFSTGEPWAELLEHAVADTVAGQRNDPSSLLSWYRQLIRVRSGEPALSLGATRLLPVTWTGEQPLVLLRELDGRTVVLVFNLGKTPCTITIPAASLPATTRFVDLLTEAAVSRGDPALPLVLADVEARGVRILRAEAR